jgi:transcriptional regulator of nitric oxide reductase
VTAWDPSPINPWTMPYVEEWRQDARQQAQASADRARELAGRPIRAEAVTVEGTPAAAMVAQSHSADLLVVGSAGHVGLGGWFSGSVSRACLHRASCPVVVVGPDAAPAAVERLVLSSTLDPEGETFTWVDAWLDRRSVSIHVIASFDFTCELPEAQLTQFQRRVRAAVRDQSHVWVERLRQVVAGRAVITEELLEGKVIDVLGSRTRAGDLVVVPSGCEHSLPFAHGTCPIAVVPSPRHSR